MTSENASNFLHSLALFLRSAKERERRLLLREYKERNLCVSPERKCTTDFQNAFKVSLERRKRRERSQSKRVKMVDFEGQKFVETFTVSVVSSTSLVGFILGYLLQDYDLMRNLIFAGILASMVVTLPSWPFLKRNPIEWREIDDEHPSAKEEDEIEEEDDEEAKKDKKENALKRMIRRVFV